MNCKQVEKLLPLYAGRDHEEKRATLVTEHVQTCAACARVVDEYRESVQLTQQFVPPIFSETVFAEVRQRVLREIETEAPAWSQTITSLFRLRLTWAIASVILIVVSIFAIYFIVNRENVGQQLADNPPAKVQPGTNERVNPGPHDDKRAALPPSVATADKKQPFAGVPRPQHKKSRNVSAQASSIPQPTLFPPRDSAALGKTLRVEIQTKDPQIRIIWFVPQESKPVIPSSKGS